MVFNVRAAECQLEHLHDLGVNAVQIAHDPPAPEFLHLMDRLGVLVMDEVFDARKKTDNDFHLLFPEWHEADLRSLIRRDRNHPSIYAWSIGNEVREKTCCGERGAEIGRKLSTMVVKEDQTRPSTVSMDVASGVRQLTHISMELALYPNANLSITSLRINYSQLVESAAQLSSRGTYTSPVTDLISAPVNDASGGNSTSLQVSSYELHTSNFESSVDKGFAAKDSNSFVAGKFVWAGWDYLGELEPSYLARSSYYGIIDLAGFSKDRYYLYQSRWRPDFKMAHILPHWTWADRISKVTPVHVSTSGDESELFPIGIPLGRKKMVHYEYRLRWDDVIYQPGKVYVVVCRNGTHWATDSVQTIGAAMGLRLKADRGEIAAGGEDLSFIALEAVDTKGHGVRDSDNAVFFSIEDPGEIVATDDGNPADLTPIPSLERKVFSGLALPIVRARKGEIGIITVSANGAGLQEGGLVVKSF